MPRFEVFDPPMCCSTGVCGPSVDPFLAAFAADVEWLTTEGVAVTRHNLAQEPQAFVANPTITALLRHEGESCLPVVLLDGAVVCKGVYPRREELARLAGLTAAASHTKPRIPLSVAARKPGCCS
jgi:hypothetical protein